MRICIFSESFFPKIGGQEMLLDQLARQYPKIGHESVILTQRGRRARSLNDEQYPYRVIRYRKPFSQVWGIPTLRRALLRLHRRWPYDVIHAQSVYPAAFAALPVAKRLGVPLVVTSHGTDLAVGSRFEKRPVIQQRIRETLRQVDAATAMSDYGTQRIVDVEPSCHDRIHRIPSAIDYPMFAAPATPSARFTEQMRGVGDRYVVFLGRLHHRKGIDILVEAFRQVANDVPDVHLVIAGEGSESDVLQQQIQQAGYSNRARLVGSVMGADKVWLLQHASLAVTPTRTWETFCLVVAEAMAAGAPVIGTKVGGISDLIQHDHNGLLVPPENAAVLAAALRELLRDEPRRRRLSDAARESARRYDVAVVAEQYLLVFTELIASKK